MAKNATIEFDDKDWKKFFWNMGSRLKDLTAILKRLYGTMGYKDILDHFKKEEGPEGKWKPRSQFTQERYEAIRRGAAEPPEGIARSAFNPSNRLLQMTGAMRSSILGHNSRTLDSRTILVWANDPKSGKHDRGVDTGFPKIPARPFMWLSNSMKQKIARGAAEYLADA